jgi:dTDP-4-amino-4,6-dideoxygalactose transaminase
LKVEFYKHSLGEPEVGQLAEVLNSTFLTTGPRTRLFEEKFAAYMGAKYAVGVTSWTMGAFITLKALGIGPGDEVITTPMTFVASANVILQCGATPVFVDVEASTGNIDVSLIEAAITPRTKAILPVHLYGQMCDMETISTIADRLGLYVFEDSAHCVEGARNAARPGSTGTAAGFSFYATKNLSSGEGGAVITNDEGLYEELKKWRLHGMSAGAVDRYVGPYRHWDMEFLGYKCNMSDIQAAMLLPQIERLDDNLKRRESICGRYQSGFEDSAGINFPEALPGTRHARHIFTVWVRPQIRDKTLAGLQDRGVGVAVNFRAVHLLHHYRTTMGFEPGDFPNAELIGDSTITLPMYPLLKDDEIDYVINSVIGTVDELTAAS